MSQQTIGTDRGDPAGSTMLGPVRLVPRGRPQLSAAPRHLGHGALPVLDPAPGRYVAS